MLVFKNIKPTDWSKFEKEVLKSERIFPEQIRVYHEEYMKILSTKNPVIMIAILDSKYIGNAIGASLTTDLIKKYEIKGVSRDPKLVYLYTFVVNPSFQRKGYGYKLLCAFVNAAKKKGYKKLAGHFNFKSAHLIQKLGAKKKGVYKNWQNTSEDYILYELDLSHVSFQV